MAGHKAWTLQTCTQLRSKKRKHPSPKPIYNVEEQDVFCRDKTTIRRTKHNLENQTANGIHKRGEGLYFRTRNLLLREVAGRFAFGILGRLCDEFSFPWQPRKTQHFQKAHVPYRQHRSFLRCHSAEGHSPYQEKTCGGGTMQTMLELFCES